MVFLAYGKDLDISLVIENRVLDLVNLRVMWAMIWLRSFEVSSEKEFGEAEVENIQNTRFISEHDLGHLTHYEFHALLSDCRLVS